MNPIFLIIILAVWLYLLHVLNKADLKAWSFLAGSLGLFVILMVYVQPHVTQPLARCVSALAGVVGKITGTFAAYFKYGIIFISAKNGSAITLKVDMECSGVIEIMAFLCLLIFYRVYSVSERIIVGVAGFCYIMLCNALRIVIICLSVYFFGTGAFYVVHTFVGRIIFYTLSVILYFYVFTKPQIIQMKVGNFKYGHNDQNT
ncbi:MAG: exosortase family protein XrtG [Lachnospiraceae bacterium]|nr:exosortase family protein XrtG [Lachnospiraceae bacterium]